MARIEVHKDDIGTRFELTFKDDGIVVDISSATVTKEVIFEKPDGTILTKTASFVTDGVDGKLQYVTVSSDIDVAGIWKLQGKVVLTAGTYKSSMHEFRVFENL